MYHFRLPLLVLAALLIGCGTPSAGIASEASSQSHGSAASADSVRALIPTGTVRVMVMDLVAPPRLEQLTARLQAAVQQEGDWWLKYVADNAQPGEPLPYHARMGISAAEYDEMLSLFDQMRLAPVSEAELKVQTAGDRRFRLDGGKHLPELTGIVIDLGRNLVETPFGTTTTSNRIVASERQQATGPWNGVSWKHDGVDPTALSGVNISFNLGRLEESGRVILSYDASRLLDGAAQGRTRRTLTYDLPPQ
jgi:hypothetical protein